MEVGVWDGNTGLTVSLTQFLLTKTLTYFPIFLLSKWYIEFLPQNVTDIFGQEKGQKQENQQFYWDKSWLQCFVRAKDLRFYNSCYSSGWYLKVRVMIARTLTVMNRNFCKHRHDLICIQLTNIYDLWYLIYYMSKYIWLYMMHILHAWFELRFMIYHIYTYKWLLWSCIESWKSLIFCVNNIWDHFLTANEYGLIEDWLLIL